MNSSASPSPLQLQQALSTVGDPLAEQDFVSAKTLRALNVEAGRVTLELEFGYPVAARAEALAGIARTALLAVPGVTEVAVEIAGKVKPHAGQRGVKRLAGVKNVIAVASGKGGVGKSTTAVNLALALAQEGARVGLLDADLYGPSQPTLLGLQGQIPASPDGKRITPLAAHGIEAMSIGFLVDGDDTPMIWRGPMAARALEQLLFDTRWNELDYLVVDMPPGTGDIQLTLSQKVALAGAVIVTTPQDIALIDAKKGLKMFEKVGVALLGVVENMSLHVCSNCGHVEHIFGEGGAEKLCADYGVPFLGDLPLARQIREEADSGIPTVAASPASPHAERYRQVARQLAIGIARLPVDYNSKLPPVVLAK